MNKFDDVFGLDEIFEIKKYLVIIGDFDLAHEARKRENILFLREKKLKIKKLRNQKIKRLEDDNI